MVHEKGLNKILIQFNDFGIRILLRSIRRLRSFRVFIQRCLWSAPLRIRFDFWYKRRLWMFLRCCCWCIYLFCVVSLSFLSQHIRWLQRSDAGENQRTQKYFHFISLNSMAWKITEYREMIAMCFGTQTVVGFLCVFACECIECYLKRMKEAIEENQVNRNTKANE